MSPQSRPDNRLPGARLAITLAFFAVLAGCTGGGAGSANRGTNAQDLSLLSVLEETRRHPEDRPASEAYCMLSIAQSRNSFPYKPFIAGILAVPEEDASRQFCAALVEAVISNHLTEDELAVFSKPSGERGFKPLGDFLRKLIAAHERLYAQQARGPQAQSCGCGQ
jgi:hypothetical protein